MPRLLAAPKDQEALMREARDVLSGRAGINLSEGVQAIEKLLRIFCQQSKPIQIIAPLKFSDDQLNNVIGIILSLRRNNAGKADSLEKSLNDTLGAVQKVTFSTRLKIA